MIDNSDGNPAPSLNITLPDWQGISFVSSTLTLAPNQIGCSCGNITFDYMIPAGNANVLSDFRLRMIQPRGTTPTTAARNHVVGDLILTADGEWHTKVIPISEWSSGFSAALAADRTYRP